MGSLEVICIKIPSHDALGWPLLRPGLQRLKLAKAHAHNHRQQKDRAPKSVDGHQ